jgi:hypothetical protein
MNMHNLAPFHDRFEIGDRDDDARVLGPADFLQICRDASYELGLTDLDTLGTEGYTLVDGIAIGVAHDPELELIQCHVNLGVVPAERRSAVYEELLIMNTEMDRDQNAVFGLHADSDSVLLHVEFPALHRVTGSTLADLMQRYAAFAQTFRRSAATATPAEGPQQAISEIMLSA